jgi:hypothetical protein
MILGATVGAATGGTPLSVTISPTFFFELVTSGTGATTGTVDAVAVGGVAPYTYAWVSDIIGLKTTTLTGVSNTLTWTAISIGVSRTANITVTVTDAASQSESYEIVAYIERIA